MQERLETLVKEACQKCGVGLYDIDLINTQHGRVLCVYIIKAGGVSITDCTSVAKILNTQLDCNEDLIDGPYTLEVSSPGLERPLKFKKHYLSAINETIKVSFTRDGKKESIIGTLAEVNNDYIVLKIKDDDVNIEFHNIKKAKTVISKEKK